MSYAETVSKPTSAWTAIALVSFALLSACGGAPADNGPPKEVAESKNDDTRAIATACGLKPEDVWVKYQYADRKQRNVIFPEKNGKRIVVKSPYVIGEQGVKANACIPAEAAKRNYEFESGSVL